MRRRGDAGVPTCLLRAPLRLLSREQYAFFMLQQLCKAAAQLIFLAHTPPTGVSQCCIEAPTKKSEHGALGWGPLLGERRYADLPWHNDVVTFTKVFRLAVTFCYNKNRRADEAAPRWHYARSDT